MNTHLYQHPKPCFARIFVRTKKKAMENQYCKVGTVTPIDQGRQAIALLEFRYQSFMEKAANMEYADARLREFFELKALKIRKLLENLV